MTAITRITARGRTTIPWEAREARKAGPGDLLAWDVEPDGTVRVRRVQPVDVEYLRAIEQTVREEWSSPADEEAYRDHRLIKGRLGKLTPADGNRVREALSELLGLT